MIWLGRDARGTQLDEALDLGRVGAELEHDMVLHHVDRLRAEDVRELDQADTIGLRLRGNLDHHQVALHNALRPVANCDHHDVRDVLQLLLDLRAAEDEECHEIRGGVDGEKDR